MIPQLIQLFCVVSVAIILVQAQFKVQLIGNYVSKNELANREYCTTKQCLTDSQILFEAASQNSTVTPCEDFKEFALGDFIKHSALNERYQYKGLQNDLDEVYKESFRKVLASKIQSNKSRTFKVMTRYFSNCIKSRKVVREGKKGVVDHLKKLGGSPFLSRDDGKWETSKFSLNKLFEVEGHDAMSLFLDHKLDRCTSPTNESEEILCFKSDYSWVNTKSSQTDMSDLLLEFTNSYVIGEVKRNELKVYINTATKRLSDFNSMKEKFEKNFREAEKSQVVTVKELSNLMPAVHLDWVKIINEQLLKTSQITENDYILVERPGLIRDLAKVVSESSNETLAEAFVLSFLYIHQWVYNVYPFDERRAENRGTSKSLQRWEICLQEIKFRMRPASEILFSQHYSDVKVQSAVDNLVNDAIVTIVQTIEEKSNLPVKMMADYKTKLENIGIIAVISEQDLSFETLEEFYDELHLTGDENYVLTWISILRFHQKVRNEDKKQWRRVLDVLLQNVYIKYDVSENILYIPWKWTMYPWFHISRPHFFNIATLFTDVLESINIALRDHITKNSNLTLFTLGLENSEQLSFDYYSNWLSQGNKELQLGANRMTNQQLFWIALARKFFVKYQPNIPKNFDPFGQLQNNFLHVLYKKQKGFQEAFGCNMSENDYKMDSMYHQEYQKITEMN